MRDENVAATGSAREGPFNVEGKQVKRPWGKKEAGVLEHQGYQGVGRLVQEGKGYGICLKD